MEFKLIEPDATYDADIGTFVDLMNRWRNAIKGVAETDFHSKESLLFQVDKSRNLCVPVQTRAAAVPWGLLYFKCEEIKQVSEQWCTGDSWWTGLTVPKGAYVVVQNNSDKSITAVYDTMAPYLIKLAAKELAYWVTVHSEIADALNPWGRFTKDPVTVYVPGKTENFRCTMRGLGVVQKQLHALDQDVTFTNRRPSKRKYEIFRLGNVEVYADAELESLAYELKAKASMPKLDGSDAQPRWKMQLGDLPPLTDEARVVKRRRPPGTTATVMGGSSEDYAIAMYTNPSTDSTAYEWLHRHGASLGGKDSTANLMCGSKPSNTWMMVYEAVAGHAVGEIRAQQGQGSGRKRQRLSPPDVSLKHEIPNADAKGKQKRWAPEKLEYHVLVGGGPICSITDMPVRCKTAPSQWLNAVVFTYYEIRKQAAASKRPKTLLMAAALEAVNTAPNPEADAPAPPQPCPFDCPMNEELQTHENNQQLAAFDQDRAKYIKERFGLASVCNVRVMTVDEQKAFFKGAVQVDRNARLWFPEVEKPGVTINQNARVITFQLTILHILCNGKAMLQFCSNDEVCHVAGLYPSAKSFVGVVAAGVAPVLQHERVVSFRNYNADIESVALCGTMAVGDLIPGLSADTKINLRGEYSDVTRFDELDLEADCKLVANIDTNVTVASGVSLTEITVGASLYHVLNVKAGTQSRQAAYYFGATLSFDAEPPASTEAVEAHEGKNITLTVTGGKAPSGGHFFGGVLRDWHSPFGLDGIRLDLVAMRFETNPNLNARVSAVLSSTTSDDSSSLSLWELEFDGVWSKEKGLGLFASFDHPMTLDDVATLHQGVTEGDKKLTVAEENAGLTLTGISASVCTKTAKTLGPKSISCPVGLVLHASMMVENRSVDVTVVISKTQGVTIQGTLRAPSSDPIAVGPIDLEELDLKVHFGGKTGGYMQATTKAAVAIPGLSGVDVVLMARLGQTKCFVAGVEGASFSLSKIDDKLSFLDFKFDTLQVSYNSTTKAQEVDLPPLSKTTTGAPVRRTVTIQSGRHLSGTVEFSLLAELLGAAAPLSFDYNFAPEEGKPHFTLMPGAQSLVVGGTAALQRRATNASGLVLGLEGTTFTAGFSATIDLFGENLTGTLGFAITPPMKVDLYSKIDVAQGIELSPIPECKLVAKSVWVSAPVIPVPDAVTVGGTVNFGARGNATATLSLKVSEDPAEDGFYLEVKNATLFDMLELTSPMVSLALPALESVPFLSDPDLFSIKEFKAYYTGATGIMVGTQQLPAEAFCFWLEANMFKLTKSIECIVQVSPTEFLMDVELPKITLGNVFKLSGFDGHQGPQFKLHLIEAAGAPSFEVLVDGAVEFLGEQCKTLVKSKSPPLEFHSQFNYEILGIEAGLTSHYSASGGASVEFSLGPSHRRQAQEEAVKQVLAAARRMEEDAKAVQRSATRAVDAFKAGRQRFVDQLAAAQEAFDAAAAKLKGVIEEGSTALRAREQDTVEEIAQLTGTEQQSQRSLAAELNRAQQTLDSGLGQAATAIISNFKALNAMSLDDDVKAAQHEFATQIAKASKNVKDALASVKHEQAESDKIKVVVKQHKHNKTSNQHDKDAAVARVADAKRHLTNMQGILSSIQDEMNARVDDVTAAYNLHHTELMRDQDRLVTRLGQLLADAAELATVVGVSKTKNKPFEDAMALLVHRPEYPHLQKLYHTEQAATKDPDFDVILKERGSLQAHKRKVIDHTNVLVKREQSIIKVTTDALDVKINKLKGMNDVAAAFETKLKEQKSKNASGGGALPPETKAEHDAQKALGEAHNSVNKIIDVDTKSVGQLLMDKAWTPVAPKANLRIQTLENLARYAKSKGHATDEFTKLIQTAKTAAGKVNGCYTALRPALAPLRNYLSVFYKNLGSVNSAAGLYGGFADALDDLQKIVHSSDVGHASLDDLMKLLAKVTTLKYATDNAANTLTDLHTDGSPKLAEVITDVVHALDESEKSQYTAAASAWEVAGSKVLTAVLAWHDSGCKEDSDRLHALVPEALSNPQVPPGLKAAMDKLWGGSATPGLGEQPAALADAATKLTTLEVALSNFLEVKFPADKEHLQSATANLDGWVDISDGVSHDLQEIQQALKAVQTPLPVTVREQQQRLLRQALALGATTEQTKKVVTCVKALKALRDHNQAAKGLQGQLDAFETLVAKGVGSIARVLKPVDALRQLLGKSTHDVADMNVLHTAVSDMDYVFSLGRGTLDHAFEALTGSVDAEVAALTTWNQLRTTFLAASDALLATAGPSSKTAFATACKAEADYLRGLDRHDYAARWAAFKTACQTSQTKAKASANKVKTWSDGDASNRAHDLQHTRPRHW